MTSPLDNAKREIGKAMVALEALLEWAGNSKDINRGDVARLRRAHRRAYGALRAAEIQRAEIDPPAPSQLKADDSALPDNVIPMGPLVRASEGCFVVRRASPEERRELRRRLRAKQEADK